jgi:hypothetical protein
MRTAVAVVAVAVVAAMAPGCGGSGGGDPSSSGGKEFSVEADTTMTTARSLTRPKFVAHVNSLCRRKWKFILNAVRQTSAITGKLHPQTSGMQRYLRGIRLSYFASLDFHLFDEIHRLGAPPGETRAVENLIGTMQEGVERGERMRISSRAQLEPLFADYNRVARGYGLDECLIAGAHIPRPEA